MKKRMTLFLNTIVQGKPLLIFSYLICLCCLSSYDVLAVNVYITGPTQVCPGQTYTYEGRATQSPSDISVYCHNYVWKINKIVNGVQQPFMAEKSTGESRFFSWTVPNTGDLSQYVIGVSARSCGIYADGGFAGVTSQIRLLPPNPISSAFPVLCPNASGTYTASFTNNTANCNANTYQYKWTLPVGWQLTNPSTTYSVAAPSFISSSPTATIKAPSNAANGEYAITVSGWVPATTTTPKFETPTTIYYIRVGPPIVTPVIGVEGASTACSNKTVFFKVNNPERGAVYNWTLYSSYAVITSGQGTNYITVNLGNRPSSVQMTVVSSNIASASGCNTSLSAGYFFSLSCPGMRLETEDSELAFSYSNPVDHSIKLNLSKKPNEEVNIALISLTGVKIKEMQASGTDAVMDVHDIASGIYLIRISSKLGTQAHKLIIQH